MGSEARPITLKIEDRGPYGKDRLHWARDQSAGGGRMNWAVAGRKIGESSVTELARAAVANIGADAAV